MRTRSQVSIFVAVTIAALILAQTSTAATCNLWGHVWNADGIPTNAQLHIETPGKAKEVGIDPTTGYYEWRNASPGAGTVKIVGGDEILNFSCFAESNTPVDHVFNDPKVPSSPPAETETCQLWGFVNDTDKSGKVCSPKPAAKLWVSLNKSSSLLDIDDKTGYFTCDNCRRGRGTAKINNSGPAVAVDCFGNNSPADPVFDSKSAVCTNPPCTLWGYVLKAGAIPNDPSDFLKFATTATQSTINDSTGLYSSCTTCVQGDNSVKYKNQGSALTPNCADGSSQRNLSFP